MELADLGPPANLTVTPHRLVLDGRGDSGVIRVRAHSAGGFAADLGAADVEVDFDERLVSVEPIAAERRVVASAGDAAMFDSRPVDSDTAAESRQAASGEDGEASDSRSVNDAAGSEGWRETAGVDDGVTADSRLANDVVAVAGWRVTARAGYGATRVDFAVGELAASIVVTVGTRSERLAGADDDWRLRTARATGRLDGGEPVGDDSARDAFDGGESALDRAGQPRARADVPIGPIELPPTRADLSTGPIDRSGAPEDQPTGHTDQPRTGVDLSTGPIKLPPGRAPQPSDRSDRPRTHSDLAADRPEPPCTGVVQPTSPTGRTHLRASPPTGRAGQPLTRAELSTDRAEQPGLGFAESTPSTGQPSQSHASPTAHEHAGSATGGTNRPSVFGESSGSYVELDYDFTQSTATRAVYADLARPVPMDGQPTSLSVWIDADGSGAWPSLECRDADGTHVVLRGEHLTWCGPRRCSMPVPSAVAYPLTLHGFYLAETRPDRRYRGRMGFGGITAEAPPPAELPAAAAAELPFPVWYPPYDDTIAQPAGRVRRDETGDGPECPHFTGNPPVHDADSGPGAFVSARRLDDTVTGTTEPSSPPVAESAQPPVPTADTTSPSFRFAADAARFAAAVTGVGKPSSRSAADAAWSPVVVAGVDSPPPRPAADTTSPPLRLAADAARSVAAVTGVGSPSPRPAADAARASTAEGNSPPHPSAPTGTPSTAGPLFTNDVTDRAWRFAVLSDTQFVAASPNDALVTAARTMLRDIVAAQPDLVLVNGDFVDEGSPADIAFARRVLAEELAGGPPWVYVPGNHEVAGGGIATFAAEFGPVRRVFGHRGVRFLTIDTSSLRIGDAQLAWLRAELNRAAADDAVGAVVVAGHVPPHDPTGHQASRLVDRGEAAALECVLAGFAATGKGCAYIAGHAGGFATWLRDGVAYVVNGNSGKAPAAPPYRGGLLGWSECGVGELRPSRVGGELVRRAPDWLAVRVRWPSGGVRVAEITPVRAIGE